MASAEEVDASELVPKLQERKRARESIAAVKLIVGAWFLVFLLLGCTYLFFCHVTQMPDCVQVILPR